MRKLAAQLGLKCQVDNVCKFIWLSKLCKRYRIDDKLRGKSISIYVLRSNSRPNINVRTVVHLPLQSDEDVSLIVRSKKFKSLFKIFGKHFRKTHDVILDKYVLIESQNDDLFKKIFHFDEISDQFANVWGAKYNKGMLVINSMGITYFEPSSFMTQKKRQRLSVAANLLCDIYDVISMSKIVQVD